MEIGSAGCQTLLVRPALTRPGAMLGKLPHEKVALLIPTMTIATNVGIRQEGFAPGASRA